MAPVTLCVPPPAVARPGDGPAAGPVPGAAEGLGWVRPGAPPAARGAAGVVLPCRPSTPANPATAPAARYHAARFMVVLPVVRGRTPRDGWLRPARRGAGRDRRCRPRTPPARTRRRPGGAGRGRAGA